MAHYDRESGRILLSTEDESLLKEASHNASNKKTPISDSIMKSILPKDYQVINLDK